MKIKTKEFNLMNDAEIFILKSRINVIVSYLYERGKYKRAWNLALRYEKLWELA